MRPSRSRFGAVVLLLFFLPLAGCEAEPPTAAVAEPRDARPTGPLAPAGFIQEIHAVNTSLAWTTVRFAPSLCLEDRPIVRAGTPLSEPLVRHLSGESVVGVTGPTRVIPPPSGPVILFPVELVDLLGPYGTLTNYEFFMMDLHLAHANASDLVEEAVATLVAGLETTYGLDLEIVPAGGYAGSAFYSVFVGVVLPDGTLIPAEDPDFEARLADESDGVLITGVPLIDLYALEFEVRPVGDVIGGPCTSPRADKQAARDLLSPHATNPEKKVRKRIEKALERLERSLDPALWVDDAHLDPKRGKKVFDHEKKAAHEILKLLKKATDEDDDSSDDDSSDDRYALDPATIADLEAALEKMLAADRALASTAIAEVDCAGDGKCEKDLSKAGEKFERAARYAAEGRIDKAIGELKKAWEKAIKAASRD